MPEPYSLGCPPPYLAEWLPLQTSAHGHEVGLLMVVAAGDADSSAEVRDSLALLSAVVGWRFDGPGQYGNAGAVRAAFDTRWVLQWAGVGTLYSPDSPADGLGTDGARLLARAALFGCR